MRNVSMVAILLICIFSCKEKWDENKDDWSKLMKATYNRDYELMDELIGKNADLNYKNNDLTALKIAIRIQDDRAVAILLKTQKTNKDLDCLTLASFGEKIEIFK